MSYTGKTKTENHVWVNRVTRSYTTTSGVDIPAPYSANTYGSATFTSTRSGTAVKDYKAKIAAGQQAGSAYSLEGTSLKYSEVSVSYSANTWSTSLPRHTGTISESFSGRVNPTTAISHIGTSLVKADSVALSLIYKKIKSEQQSMNSPAVLAEFVDVLRQFGSPARSLVDLTNRHLNRLQLERRRLSGSVSFRKIKWHEIVASTYLEWSFGLAPLISDTRSASEALARLHAEHEGLLRPRKRVVSRGIDVATQAYSAVSLKPPNCQYIRLKETTSKRTECRVQYIAGLTSTLRADLGSNERLLQILGFDHGNWVPAIWEAVPWSWLVDYFTNVQQILEASVTNTSDVAWLVKTVSYRTDFVKVHAPDVVGSDLESKTAGQRVSSLTGKAGKQEVVRTTLTRTLPVSLGIPALYFELPSSVKQLANMTAVLFARKPSSSALWLT